MRRTQYSTLTNDELLNLVQAGKYGGLDLPDLTIELAGRLEEMMPAKRWMDSGPRPRTKYRGDNTRK